MDNDYSPPSWSLSPITDTTANINNPSTITEQFNALCAMPPIQCISPLIPSPYEFPSAIYSSRQHQEIISDATHSTNAIHDHSAAPPQQHVQKSQCKTDCPLDDIANVQRTDDADRKMQSEKVNTSTGPSRHNTHSNPLQVQVNIRSERRTPDSMEPEETDRYRCDHCDERFGHQHAMDRHRQMHSGPQRFRCKSCGKKFTEYKAYKRHKKNKKRRKKNQKVVVVKIKIVL
eukprot:24733_1